MLKLKDIVYEITPHCDKGCIECGSREISFLPNPTPRKIERIVDAILQYPPETITLTGGEPGFLPAGLLDEVVDSLSSKCVVNIVTNGAIFKLGSVNPKFGTIGLSINKVADAAILDNTNCAYNMPRITMITNFGTHNIWNFDELAQIAEKFNVWQIQLTMGKYMLPPAGIEYLLKKIDNLSNIKVILADNLTPDRKCLAGINMCGITYDGEVIPCLSERSCHMCTVSSQGNILGSDLKTIWEHGFEDIRFGDGWCNECRKDIKYPEKKEEPFKLPRGGDLIYWNHEKYTSPNVYLYAVGDEPMGVYTYAVVGSGYTLSNN